MTAALLCTFRFISFHFISFHSSRAVGSVSFVPSRVFTTTDATKKRGVRASRPRASTRHRFTRARIHHSCIIHASFIHHSIPSSARARRASTSSLASFARALVSRFDVKKAAVESRLQKLSRASVTGRATWGWKESFQPAIFRDQSRLHIDGYNPMRKDVFRVDRGRGFRTDRVCARASSRLWVRMGGECLSDVSE